MQNMVRGIVIVLVSIIHFTIGQLAFSQGLMISQSYSRSVGKGETIQISPCFEKPVRCVGLWASAFDRSLR